MLLAASLGKEMSFLLRKYPCRNCILCVGCGFAQLSGPLLARLCNGEGVHYLLFGFINIRLNYLRRMWLIKIKRRNGQSGNSHK